MAEATQASYSAPQSYTDIEQQKLLGDALAAASKAGDQDGKDDTKSDFGKLMPTWMLAVGGTYAELQKDYDPNSQVGKFIRYLQALSTVQQAFMQAVQGASSFDTLKYFLNNDKYFTQMCNDVGLSANEMKENLNSFTPQKGSSASQVEQEKQSEFNIVTSQAQVLQDEGSKQQNTAQSMQQNGNAIFSDSTDIGNFIAQISDTGNS